MRARVVLAERVGALRGSQPLSVRGPADQAVWHAGVGLLAACLAIWRWPTWQCFVWPPTHVGALLWRHMHMVYGPTESTQQGDRTPSRLAGKGRKKRCKIIFSWNILNWTRKRWAKWKEGFVISEHFITWLHCIFIQVNLKMVGLSNKEYSKQYFTLK